MCILAMPYRTGLAINECEVKQVVVPRVGIIMAVCFEVRSCVCAQLKRRAPASGHATRAAAGREGRTGPAFKVAGIERLGTWHAERGQMNAP